jgi:hypothetical protein
LSFPCSGRVWLGRRGLGPVALVQVKWEVQLFECGCSDDSARCHGVARVPDGPHWHLADSRCSASGPAGPGRLLPVVAPRARAGSESARRALDTATGTLPLRATTTGSGASCVWVSLGNAMKAKQSCALPGLRSFENPFKLSEGAPAAVAAGWPPRGRASEVAGPAATAYENGPRGLATGNSSSTASLPQAGLRKVPVAPWQELEGTSALSIRRWGAPGLRTVTVRRLTGVTADSPGAQAAPTSLVGHSYDVSSTVTKTAIFQETLSPTQTRTRRALLTSTYSNLHTLLVFNLKFTPVLVLHRE